MQATGQFAGLTPAVSAQLRNDQAERDLLLSAFTPAGTFTYTPTLTGFTLRYLLRGLGGLGLAADETAGVEGELMAAQFLESRGITHRPLTVTAVCMNDVKLKPVPTGHEPSPSVNGE